eukprot:11866640-Heterocapsa_arctica.AAC.1
MEGVISNGGCATLEHPDDPGGHPFASVFATPQLQHVVGRVGGCKITLDQCMSGCEVRKRTGLAGLLPNMHVMAE